MNQTSVPTLLICLLFALPATVAQDAKEGEWIDLLKLVDTKKNAIAGEWAKSDEGLSVKAAQGARLTLPWKPTDEYDFEITFTRHSGSNSIALIFVAGKNQASLDIDGWGQHLAGIQNISGRTIRDNQTRVADMQLENHKKYTAAVKVRKAGVQALLDGKELTRYEGERTALSLLDLWKLPDQHSLGIGAWESATTFEAIRVRPIGKSSSDTTPLTPQQPRESATDDLAELSDEFDDAQTLKDWRRVFETEKTEADQLLRFDIGRSEKGWMTMVPHTSTWYQDYRGVLAYKPVKGDFVVTTQVRASNRTGNGPPRSNFSLAGIMVRNPRDVTPQTWRPGGENYIFLSLGAARQAGRFAFEVKTTVNSRSDLEIDETDSGEAMIQVARIGEHFLLLKKPKGGSWSVHRRYRRQDFADELQVGLTVYTDYASASRLNPQQHNVQVIRGGTPDLIASFDYLRFRRLQVPAELRGRVFSDPRSVSDANVLKLLGDTVAAAQPASTDQGSVNPPSSQETSVGKTESKQPAVADDRTASDVVSAEQAAGDVSEWQADVAGYEKIAAPLLNAHCLKCHGPETQEGDFRVDRHLPNNFFSPSAVEKWEEVLHMLDTGEMPPAEEPRPPAAEVRRLSEWIQQQQRRAEAASGGTRVVLRRLNREEYNNTIRDLMGLDFRPAADFPADPPAAGFDNVGSALTISPLHLELYLKTAQEILDRAIVTVRQRPAPIRWRFQPEDGNYGLDRHRVNVDGQQMIVNAGNNLIRNGMVVMRFDDWDRGCGFRNFTVPHAGDYVIRIRAAGDVPEENAVRQAGLELQFERQKQQEARLASEQERARSRNAFDRYVQPLAKKHFAEDRSYRYGPPRMKVAGTLGGRIRVLGEMDVSAPVDDPQVYEVRAWFEPTVAGVSLHNVYNVPRQQFNAWLQRYEGFPRPELHVDWIEMEGPVYDQWPPNSHQSIFIDSPNRGKDEIAYVRDVLSHFMRRAFRRPLQNGELESKVALFQKVRSQKASLEEAIKVPLTAILCSPHFLYLVEEQPALSGDELASYRVFRDRNDRELEGRILATKDDQVAIRRKDGKRFVIEIAEFSVSDQQYIRDWEPQANSPSSRPLNDFELAARLAYFLWSSMPDEELSRLAESGRLSDSRVLAEQVDRMLADAKSAALVKNFAGQWLRLREVGANPPVEAIYPRYDNHLEVSMRRESEEFFTHILRNDLHVDNFIRSDFVTINERLARFYDIAGVVGDDFRVVNVPGNQARGGLVTQASILAVTSNGTRTSPVWRGVWILENLLGDSTPPPPPNAGDIPPGVPGTDKATVRERLRLHREQAQCARCHDRIDPLGFALENFNAAGDWREREASFNRPEPRDDDPLIDASARLPDGTRFVGVKGLQEQLLRRSDQFKLCLSEKMFTYALGREIGAIDRGTVESAVAHMNGQGATLRSLIKYIVASEPFLTK